MQEYILNLNFETRILIVLAVLLLSGFVLTRFTNTLNLPKVSGYILAGIVIGPYFLNLAPKDITNHMDFISDLALSFIAFGVGKFFKKEVLMQTGKKVMLLTICEALMAGVLVTFTTYYFFSTSLNFAIILGSIATATAPASTMMTINQYRAKGEFIDTLLQVVALDDVVCLLAFSIASSIAKTSNDGNFSIYDILNPIGLNMFAICVGLFCGYFLSKLLVPQRSKDNRLILVIALLCGISGICAAINVSPLLSCMVFGASYINLTKDKRLFKQINNFTPPIMSLFFIVSGINLDISALKTVGIIGVVYFFVRIVGKYFGTFACAKVLKMDENIKKYLGLALVPQAGVSIGLAYLGQRLLPPNMGNMLLTIILSSAVLYEMVGPISAKIALSCSGCINFNATPPEENMVENSIVENTEQIVADKNIIEEVIENIADCDESLDIMEENQDENNGTETIEDIFNEIADEGEIIDNVEEQSEPVDDQVEEEPDVLESEDIVENLELRIEKKKKDKKKKGKKKKKKR